MSRADGRVASVATGPGDRPGPGIGLGGAAKAALFDFYYQSIRLVPANVAWGLTLLAIVAVALATGPLVTLAIAPLLAIPYVGVMRLAVLTARGRDVVLSDAFAAYRAFAAPALAAGAGFVLAAAVFGTNVVAGAATGGVAGWAFATLAAWGLVATWVYGLVFWVVLVDPARAGVPFMRKAHLAAMVVLAAPGRLAALGLFSGVILAVSTVAIAAVLTISVAYTALVAARYVLPLSDRLETWLESRASGAAAE